jgi:hypothetical protein
MKSIRAKEMDQKDSSNRRRIGISGECEHNRIIRAQFSQKRTQLL